MALFSYTFLFFLLLGFGPGFGEGVVGEGFFLLHFFHVGLGFSFGHVLFFVFELLVEAVVFFAEAAFADVEPFVAAADDF